MDHELVVGPGRRGTRGRPWCRFPAGRRRTAAASGGFSRGRCRRRWGGGCRPRPPARGRRACSRSMAIAPSTNWREIAFLPGEEDRERGHLDRRRRVAGHFQESLRVGHHQGRRAVEAVQGVAQLALLHHQAHRRRRPAGRGSSAPAAGSAGPWGLPCRWARRARPARPAARGRRQSRGGLRNSSGAVLNEGFAKFKDAATLRGDRFNAWHLCLDFSASSTAAGGLRFVGLVEDDDCRDIALGEFLEDGLLEPVPVAGVDNDEPQVGAVEDLAGLLHAELAEGPFVVDAGRIDEQHRARSAASPSAFPPGRSSCRRCRRRSRPAAESARSAATTCPRCGGRIARCGGGRIWGCVPSAVHSIGNGYGMEPGLNPASGQVTTVGMTLLSNELAAARCRIETAYDPELLRAAGHRLADLLANHLTTVEAAGGDVLPWRPPEENVRLAADLLRQASGTEANREQLVEAFPAWWKRCWPTGITCTIRGTSAIKCLPRCRWPG